MASKKPSFADLINGEQPVLVDFYADWCGPCRMMTPIVQEIAAEMGDKLRVIKIDVDKNPQLSDKYQIRGIPTFILFHKGKVLWQQSGAMAGSQFKNAMKQYVK